MDTLQHPRPVTVIVALLLLAGSQYAWNAYSLPAFVGYDWLGHTRYVAIIAEQGRLPEPLEGWSTFHPPLYYLIASGLFELLADRGDRVVTFGLRALSSVAILVAGLVAFRLLLRLGADLGVAAVASALVLFVPCSQLAAAMVGNEAFGAGLAALALPPLLTLQSEPRNLRASSSAALFAGLALATKYTGFFVAAACAIPFLRRDLDAAAVRSLLACVVLGSAIAGPVYLRNLALTGTPLPMTRNHEPMKGAEERFVIRERRLVDYLWLDPSIFAQPSLYLEEAKRPDLAKLNPAMSNFWSTLYASIWYDPFATRVSSVFSDEGRRVDSLLLLLGVAPTGVMLIGFAAGIGDLVRSRLRSPDAPLVAMATLAMAVFVGFSVGAPSPMALKGSYLLPLVVPAAVFYARGAALLPARARSVALCVSALAAATSAIVLTNGLVLPDPLPNG